MGEYDKNLEGADAPDADEPAQMGGLAGFADTAAGQGGPSDQGAIASELDPRASGDAA
jgi:hypothetical protein